MLISKDQFVVFETVQLTAFKKRMEVYFEDLRYNPQQVAASKIREFVDNGIAFARHHFSTEAALHKFLLTCWLIGLDKVQTSGLAMKHVDDSDYGELDRADILLDEVLACLLMDSTWRRQGE